MKEKFAFPSIEPQSEYDADHPGMTLRDYFAGQALSGLISENAHPQSAGSWESVGEICDEAYNFADTMLISRNKEQQSHE